MKTINSHIASDPRSSKYGAPIGCGDILNMDSGILQCAPLRMVDGDYGPDGTYWGSGSREHGWMYVIYNRKEREYEFACGALQYIRAKSRDAAISKFLGTHSGFTFTHVGAENEN